MSCLQSSGGEPGTSLTESELEQALGVAHESGLSAEFLQAAVHLARDRGPQQIVRNLGVGRDQMLHLLGGDAIAESVFDGGDIETGKILARRAQAKDFSLAALVENQSVTGQS